MKALKAMNSIAIGIPLFIALFGIFGESALILAIVSTMATGLIQIIVGLFFWTKHKDNIHIKVYFSLVASFFSLWYYNVNVNYIDALTWPLIFTPLVLCIYISIIIYSTKK